MLPRLAEALTGLSAGRAALAAFGLGLLAALALPPLYLVPLLWPAFTGLVWLLDAAARSRRALAVGWCFGFGYHLAGLFWVGSAVLVVAEQFWWFLPFAVLGLPAGMALFTAAAAAAARRVFWRGPARVVGLATAWLALEWLRSWILTGFPWNQPGSVWAFSDSMLQAAALGGIWGLTFMTVLVAAAPATLVDRRADQRADRAAGRVSTWAAWGLPAAGLVLLALVWAGGALRLAGAPQPGSDLVPGVTLRLVQPAVDQKLKWRPELRLGHLRDLVTLSRNGDGSEKAAAAAGPITHVVWPEMAFTYALGENGQAMEGLLAAVPQDGLVITGLPRWARDPQGRPMIWNSLAAVSVTGAATAVYDKEHLVPFGEFVPALITRVLGMAKLTHGRVDFSRGPGRRTLEVVGLPPVSPLICYEVIFPGAVTDGEGRAAWLLNLTNDAWFGESSGPHQHFVSARLRAVEEGLPLVRVANSGISAVVDGYGRVRGFLPLGARGVIDAGLPQPADGRTPFAALGNLTLAILLGLGALLTIVIGQRS
ncbi:MAG: apolipoprotein N-acyltransferase [Kiloniellales bacterium]|nr:apolipoprotein N-acyltransferase [Kiloniellales bacterium]